MGKLVAALLLVAAVLTALFHPASPLSIDVARANVAAGETRTVSLGGASIEVAASQAAEVSVRRIRDLPRQDGTGEAYEFKTIPAIVDDAHPAKITVPLDRPATPGTRTLVAFKTQDGWEAHIADVG